MQAETYHSMNEFQKEAGFFKAKFLDDAPLSDNDFDIEKAFSVLTEYKENVTAFRKRED